jgi:hypothetical protein
MRLKKKYTISNLDNEKYKDFSVSKEQIMKPKLIVKKVDNRFYFENWIFKDNKYIFLNQYGPFDLEKAIDFTDYFTLLQYDVEIKDNYLKHKFKKNEQLSLFS